MCDPFHGHLYFNSEEELWTSGLSDTLLDFKGNTHLKPKVLSRLPQILPLVRILVSASVSRGSAGGPGCKQKVKGGHREGCQLPPGRGDSTQPAPVPGGRLGS